MIQFKKKVIKKEYEVIINKLNILSIDYNLIINATPRQPAGDNLRFIHIFNINTRT